MADIQKPPETASRLQAEVILLRSALLRLLDASQNHPGDLRAAQENAAHVLEARRPPP